MKNLMERLKMIFTAIVCFFMNMFPARNGKRPAGKNVKVKNRFANDFSEEPVYHESIVCKNPLRNTDIPQKYKVYWHELLVKIQGNILGYYASG